MSASEVVPSRPLRDLTWVLLRTSPTVPGRGGRDDPKPRCGLTTLAGRLVVHAADLRSPDGNYTDNHVPDTTEGVAFTARRAPPALVAGPTGTLLLAALLTSQGLLE